MRRKQLRDWRSRPRCKIDLRRGCPRGPEKAVIDRRVLSYLRGVCRRLNYAVILRRTGWLPFRAFVLFLPSFIHSSRPLCALFWLFCPRCPHPHSPLFRTPMLSKKRLLIKHPKEMKQRSILYDTSMAVSGFAYLPEVETECFPHS